MVLFIELKISDRTIVHGIFEVVLGHESGNELPQILFFDAHLIRYVGDH